MQADAVLRSTSRPKKLDSQVVRRLPVLESIAWEDSSKSWSMEVPSIFPESPKRMDESEGIG